MSSVVGRCGLEEEWKCVICGRAAGGTWSGRCARETVLIRLCQTEPKFGQCVTFGNNPDGPGGIPGTFKPTFPEHGTSGTRTFEKAADLAEMRTWNSCMCEVEQHCMEI